MTRVPIRSALLDEVAHLADPVFDLEHLTSADTAAIERDLRTLGSGAKYRQAVAERIVSYFYEGFRVPADGGDDSAPNAGEPACVLVRCFQTCPYARLPLEYQYAADDMFANVVSRPDMRCLALLATRGTKLVWNEVATSINHQSIPLPSVEVVKRAPMIARLLEQIGVSLERVVMPPDSPGFLVDQASGSFNVFHIERALGSPFIPAQAEFVEPYDVQSVLGIGGLLSDGELFAVLLFTRVPVSRQVAELFLSLADSVKSALLPFPAEKTFETLRG